MEGAGSCRVVDGLRCVCPDVTRLQGRDEPSLDTVVAGVADEEVVPCVDREPRGVGEGELSGASAACPGRVLIRAAFVELEYALGGCVFDKDVFLLFTAMAPGSVRFSTPLPTVFSSSPVSVNSSIGAVLLVSAVQM